MNRIVIVLTLGLLAPSLAWAQQALVAQASVSVSDGLRYEVVTFYAAQDRAVFHREYPQRTVTMAVDGVRVWQQEDNDRKDGSAFTELFVLGHQFHALLLWPEQFFPGEELRPQLAEDCNCLRSDNLDRFGNRVQVEFDRDTGRALANTTWIVNEGPVIHYRYKHWRLAGPHFLPHTVLIDDGSRQFRYKFHEISNELDEQQHREWFGQSDAVRGD